MHIVSLPEKAFDVFLWRALINIGVKYDKKVNVADSFRKLHFKWEERERFEKKKKGERENEISIAREGCREGVADAGVSTYVSLLGFNVGQ